MFPIQISVGECHLVIFRNLVSRKLCCVFPLNFEGYQRRNRNGFGLGYGILLPHCINGEALIHTQHIIGIDVRFGGILIGTPPQECAVGLGHAALVCHNGVTAHGYGLWSRLIGAAIGIIGQSNRLAGIGAPLGNHSPGDSAAVPASHDDLSLPLVIVAVAAVTPASKDVAGAAGTFGYLLIEGMGGTVVAGQVHGCFLVRGLTVQCASVIVPGQEVTVGGGRSRVLGSLINQVYTFATIQSNAALYAAVNIKTRAFAATKNLPPTFV